MSEITAEQARHNMAISKKEATRLELKHIYNWIKLESINGDSINWISMDHIEEDNISQLRINGFDVSKYTIGANKGTWRISW